MDEIDRIAPPDWQIWLATHSIGMVRWATQHLETHTGVVAFLDFASPDFDVPTTIEPVKPTRQFWNRQFAVAIGELADLLVPRELIVCEGRNDASQGFDADVLDRIFGETHPNTGFISVGGCSEVERNGALLSAQLGKLTPGCTVRRLYDRDDRTDNEIEQVRNAGDSVLSVREIENYLFDKEIIRLLVSKHNAGQWSAIEHAMDAEIATLTSPSRRKPADDMKSAA